MWITRPESRPSRFPNIRQPKQQDICYATQNRQDAVKAMVPYVDVVVVVGSQNSSNSKRLQELASSLHIPAYLVDDPIQIEKKWFRGVANIGITAGASAPEALTAKIIEAVNQEHVSSYPVIKTCSVLGAQAAPTGQFSYRIQMTVENGQQYAIYHLFYGLYQEALVKAGIDLPAMSLVTGK